MSSTQSTVLQNAAYHTQLLDTIAALDYAPSALRQQEELIAGFKAQRQQTQLNIAVLKKKTKKEREEHEALRDSTARRLAHKLTGRKEKFEAKASKEEREYVEALERELQEKRQLATLESVISEAEIEHTDLLSKLAIHKLAKEDLAALYSQIFDGITQEYPEDDQLEEQLQIAQAQYDEIQGRLNQESQALNLLHSANGALTACNKSVQEALGYSQWDMWGGGAGMADMMERNALGAAEGQAMQAAMFVQQAQSVSPAVQPLGEIKIAHGSMLGDVIFDNILSDMAFNDKIKATKRNVEAVQQSLARQITAADARTNAVGAELSGAAQRLAQRRAALAAFRQRVFAELMPSPPAYDGATASRIPAGASSPSFADAQSQSQAEAGYAQAPHAETPSYAAPPGPPPHAGTPSYAAPLGPPPPSQAAVKFPTPAHPPPPPAASDVPSWGSRNPYAAALAAGRK